MKSKECACSHFEKKIQRTLFDGMGTPLKIRDGFVGKFRLVVPWTSLNTKPSILELDDVLIIVVPNYATFEVLGERERERFYFIFLFLFSDILFL
jgi:hypothetical protein